MIDRSRSIKVSLCYEKKSICGKDAEIYPEEVDSLAEFAGG